MQLDQRECEQTYCYMLRACSHHCHPVTQLKCNIAKAPPVTQSHCHSHPGGVQDRGKKM